MNRIFLLFITFFISSCTYTNIGQGIFKKKEEIIFISPNYYKSNKNFDGFSIGNVKIDTIYLNKVTFNPTIKKKNLAYRQHNARIYYFDNILWADQPQLIFTDFFINSIKKNKIANYVGQSINWQKPYIKMEIYVSKMNIYESEENKYFILDISISIFDEKQNILGVKNIVKQSEFNSYNDIPEISQNILHETMAELFNWMTIEFKNNS